MRRGDSYTDTVTCCNTKRRVIPMGPKRCFLFPNFPYRTAGKVSLEGDARVHT